MQFRGGGVALFFFVAILGCSAAPRGRAAPLPDAIVKISCNVPSAEVWVDERYVAEVGSVSEGISMAPGDHRLTIRHDGYHTFYAELTLGAKEQRVLVANLAARLP